MLGFGCVKEQWYLRLKPRLVSSDKVDLAPRKHTMGLADIGKKKQKKNTETDYNSFMIYDVIILL